MNFIAATLVSTKFGIKKVRTRVNESGHFCLGRGSMDWWNRRRPGFLCALPALFIMKYSVAIEEGSTKAGFVYGANDLRLMEIYKNIDQLKNTENENYIKLELDISNVDGSKNDLAILHIYRVCSKKIYQRITIGQI